MSTQRRRFLYGTTFALAATGVAVGLFYRYADAIRTHVVRPAIETYYVVRYYIDLVPQLFWWMIPPAVVSLVLLRRFLRPPTSDAAPQAPKSLSIRPGEGELTHLVRLVQRAHHSRFARVRLSRTLVEVAARLIAGREGIPLATARKMMLDGYWRTSRSMHHFLTPRRHYTARQGSAEFREALQETLDQLEDHDRTA